MEDVAMKMNVSKIQELVATYKHNNELIASKVHPSFVRFLTKYNTKIKYKFLLECGGKSSMV